MTEIMMTDENLDFLTPLFRETGTDTGQSFWSETRFSVYLNNRVIKILMRQHPNVKYLVFRINDSKCYSKSLERFKIKFTSTGKCQFEPRDRVIL